MKILEANISYHAIDLATMFTHSQFKYVLKNLLQQALDNNYIRPLPHKIFESSQVADGLRYLSAGKQVGKVLISMQTTSMKHTQEESNDNNNNNNSNNIKTTLATTTTTTSTIPEQSNNNKEPTAVIDTMPCSPRFVTSGTHVIIGGLGGFGMELGIHTHIYIV